MGRLESLARGTPTGTQLRTVALANPDPGVGFALTPDAGRAWEVLSIFFLLVTSETDATRYPSLAYQVGDQLVWVLGNSDGIGASMTGAFLWLADWSFASAPTSGITIAGSMPHVILQPGYSLTVELLNVDAADQVSMIVAQVLEVSTGTREAERDAAERFAERLGAFLDLSREDY